MNIRVLVFPCGTEIGLEIHNSLRWSPHLEIYGATSIADHGKFVYRKYIEDVPFVDRPNFVKEIRKVIKGNKIDFFFPSHDSVISKLARETDNLGCRLITSPLKTCEICRSKGKTYELFSKDLRLPKVYRASGKKIPFPVFLKPDAGQGAVGTYRVDSYEEIRFYLRKDPTLLVSEYLPGKEYTVDCFTDRYGILRFVGPRERARILHGISVNSFPVKRPAFDNIANIINQKLVFRGVWFFQVKEASDGELALMEIAPRVGGTMGLTRNMGVNLPLLSVYDALDMDIIIEKHAHSVEVDRALISRYTTDLKFKHVYVDLDDTIIFKKEINPFLITFLYQCINRGIVLHLLSCHEKTFKEPLKRALRRFRLSTIFDEIKSVSAKKEKYEFIDDRSGSIFIDDSFSERKKVSDELGIPTFDPSEIESLLDWRF